VVPRISRLVIAWNTFNVSDFQENFRKTFGEKARYWPWSPFSSLSPENLPQFFLKPLDIDAKMCLIAGRGTLAGLEWQRGRRMLLKSPITKRRGKVSVDWYEKAKARDSGWSHQLGSFLGPVSDTDRFEHRITFDEAKDSNREGRSYASLQERQQWDIPTEGGLNLVL
jgi:hypothetical protein